MKKVFGLLALLLVAVMLLTGAVAESSLDASVDGFLGNLGDTWDSFLNMAGEAADAAGVWAGDAAQKFIEENLPEIQKWVDEAGQYFGDNVSPDVEAAWNVLLDGAAQLGNYTKDELENAFDTLEDWINANDVDLQTALDALAKAAGLDVNS